MPAPKKYVNLRASLPGEHDPKAVERRGPYTFVGGKFEVRLTEATAYKQAKVLEAYHGAKCERVPDAAVHAESQSPEPAQTEVATPSSDDSSRARNGSEKSSSDSKQSDNAKAGQSGHETSSEVGRHSADNQDQSDEDVASSLV